MWGPWIAHDDAGWPKGVEPDEVVLPEIAGDILCPMAAISVDWCCPGDPVTRYRRRIYPEMKATDEMECEA